MTKESPIQIRQTDKSGISSTKKGVVKRLDDLDGVVKAVLFIIAVTVATMLLGGYTLILDQEHFNYETYQEKSGEFQQEITNLQKQNTDLQSQVNTLKQSNTVR